MYTTYALVVSTSKIPNDFGNTGYFNTDLALNMFHIFHTATNTARMFGSWELNDDRVTHLHLVFGHQGRVDTLNANYTLTRSFPNLFRYYIKIPMVLLSTEQELLDATL